MASCTKEVSLVFFNDVLPPDEGREILNEIHSGDCGHHACSRSLVAKAFRHGFYWLTAHADAEDIVRKCDGCQKFARQAHVSAQELRMIPTTWPFAIWGLDMVGPLKRSKDKKTHLLVVVDKFTKWVLITHKYRGSQQFLRVEYSTQIY
jgi:hypothetical protein